MDMAARRRMMNDSVYVCARACHCQNVYTFAWKTQRISVVHLWECVCVSADCPVEHVVSGFLGRRGDRRGLYVHMPPSAGRSVCLSLLSPCCLSHSLTLPVSPFPAFLLLWSLCLSLTRLFRTNPLQNQSSTSTYCNKNLFTYTIKKLFWGPCVSQTVITVISTWM